MDKFAVAAIVFLLLGIMFAVMAVGHTLDRGLSEISTSLRQIPQPTPIVVYVESPRQPIYIYPAP